MTLQIHNTLAGERQVFAPIDPKNVRMYVCGPTVYDYIHIGNARPIVVFDVLFRLLRHLYGADHVTYVRNITDVDDKINARAQQEGVAISELTERTAEAFHNDIAQLGVLAPSVEPRATQHIPEMIAMMQSLIDKGHAYAAEGHVLFSVPSMADYGRLSKLDRDSLIAGARIDVAPYKKDPADFVLWKPSANDIPGWESPWGYGRPGWHLECSAMSEKHLGETFDIHGGGLDLVFPHHENEIAQSSCAHGKTFVNYWMHNGYVISGGEKMSKSLGNFVTLHELLADFPGEAVRLALLSGQYRGPLDITRDKIGESKKQLDRLYGALRSLKDVEPVAPEVPAAVLAALCDDMNTPLALAELHEIASGLNKAESLPEQASLKASLLAAGALLGLLQGDPETWFTGDSASAEIDALIERRNAARKAKDFAESDRLRDALKAKGIVLEDGPGGTTWKRAD